jgi:hypothetical protein
MLYGIKELWQKQGGSPVPLNKGVVRTAEGTRRAARMYADIYLGGGLVYFQTYVSVPMFSYTDIGSRFMPGFWADPKEPPGYAPKTFNGTYESPTGKIRVLEYYVPTGSGGGYAETRIVIFGNPFGSHYLYVGMRELTYPKEDLYISAWVYVGGEYVDSHNPGTVGGKVVLSNGKLSVAVGMLFAVDMSKSPAEIAECDGWG